MTGLLTRPWLLERALYFLSDGSEGSTAERYGQVYCDKKTHFFTDGFHVIQLDQIEKFQQCDGCVIIPKSFGFRVVFPSSHYTTLIDEGCGVIGKRISIMKVPQILHRQWDVVDQYRRDNNNISDSSDSEELSLEACIIPAYQRLDREGNPFTLHSQQEPLVETCHVPHVKARKSMPLTQSQGAYSVGGAEIEILSESDTSEDAILDLSGEESAIASTLPEIEETRNDTEEEMIQDESEAEDVAMEEQWSLKEALLEERRIEVEEAGTVEALLEERRIEVEEAGTVEAAIALEGERERAVEVAMEEKRAAQAAVMEKEKMVEAAAMEEEQVAEEVVAMEEVWDCKPVYSQWVKGILKTNIWD